MLSLRVVVVFCKRRISGGEWKIWLVKRYPTVEMRSTNSPVMLASNELLLQYFLPSLQSSNEEEEEFALRALSLHAQNDDDACVVDELMRDLLGVLLQCRHFDEMEHKLRFIKQLNVMVPFGTPTNTIRLLESNEYVDGGLVLKRGSTNSRTHSMKWKKNMANSHVVFREDAISLITYKEEITNWMMESRLLLTTTTHNNNEEEITVKFASPIIGLLPAHECVQRFDSSQLTFRAPYSTTPICVLAQWQITNAPPLDIPLHVAYRLRKAGERGFHLVVKVSLDVTSFVRLDVKLHLPARVVDVSKLKFNQHNHSNPVRFNGSCIYLSVKSPSTALLQGFVECSSTQGNDDESRENSLLFQGETSCAEVDFEWKQAENELSSTYCKTGQRVVKSGKYIVWNPFGDLPLGSFAVLKHKV